MSRGSRLETSFFFFTYVLSLCFIFFLNIIFKANSLVRSFSLSLYYLSCLFLIPTFRYSIKLHIFRHTHALFLSLSQVRTHTQAFDNHHAITFVVNRPRMGGWKLPVGDPAQRVRSPAKSHPFDSTLPLFFVLEGETINRLDKIKKYFDRVVRFFSSSPPHWMLNWRQKCIVRKKWWCHVVKLWEWALKMKKCW